MSSSPRLPLLLLLALPACPGGGGSSTGTDTDPTTGTTTEPGTSTSTSDPGTATDPTTGTPTSTGPGTGSTTDAPPVCEPPVNQEPGAMVATITIRNSSANTVYVLPKSQFVCNYAKVEIDIDGENVHWDHPGVYPYPCDAGRCQWGCTDGGDNGFIIKPGGVAEVPWNGAIWAHETLEPVCLDEFGCPDSGTECEARRDLGAVTYTARAQITDTCPGEQGACDDCAEDVCELFVYEPDFFRTTQTIEATSTFPAGAEIVIE